MVLRVSTRLLLLRLSGATNTANALMVTDPLFELCSIIWEALCLIYKLVPTYPRTISRVAGRRDGGVGADVE